MKGTNKERVIDTVCFKHHAIAVLELTQADCIIKATKDLERTLTTPTDLSHKDKTKFIQDPAPHPV